jgi:pilus retraction protein PilT
MDAGHKIKTSQEMLQVLDQLFQQKVSDIFVCAERPIHVRLHGDVKPTTTCAPAEDVLIELINTSGNVRVEGRLSDMQKHPLGSVDGAITAHGNRYRFNFYRALDPQTMRQTVRMSLRPLSSRIPAPEEIGLPSRVLKVVDELQQGLVLVCGKTGQGKSTTLASILQHRADQFEEHLITLEQPVEFLLRDGKSIVSQREVGVSVDTFATGLRSALRQNPDTLLVGEIRDHETAEIALSASESGHLVLGTLHTSNAAQSVERFVNLFPTAQQHAVWSVLSATLKAVLCQMLVKDREGSRVAAREILLGNESVASYVKSRDLNGVRRAIESGHAEFGMQNWAKAAELLYREGRIDEARRRNIIALGE